MMAKFLSHLEAVYDVYFSGSMFLDGPAIDRLQFNLYRMGECHMWLREACRSRGELAWQVLPKCHQAQHLGMQARLINPRFVMNYLEESCAVFLSKIWKGSLDGRFEETVQATVLLKYLVVLQYKLNLLVNYLTK